MRIITVLGLVDTRIIVYPLARALSLTGMTAIISEDGAYRRLYLDKGLKGTVNGVDISVGVDLDEKLRNSLNDTGISYDNIILVTSDTIPKDSTGAIICRGVDKSMLSDYKIDGEEQEEEVIEDSIDIPEGLEYSKVFISFEQMPKKGIYSIGLSDNDIRYVYSCEERKELLIIPDKNLNKTLAKVYSKPTGLSESELFSLLTRKEYIPSGKVK